MMPYYDPNCMLLRMTRDIYQDISEIPHFGFQLSYAGHCLEYDDIYFSDLATIKKCLHEFYEQRRGEVFFDGGMRLKLWLKALPVGNVEFAFYVEQFPPQFPGECSLRGEFPVEGGSVEYLIELLSDLLENGSAFRIEKYISQDWVVLSSE